MVTEQKNDIPRVSNENAGATRRTFINRLWAGLGLLAFLELIGVGLAFLRRGKTAASAETEAATVTCGVVDQYAPGSVTAFVRGRFYLVRLADGGFLAISRQCTHLGCTVPWDNESQRFACPCHASVFDIAGSVIQAPAPRALDHFPMKIESQTITVDTRTPMRRSGFEPHQAVYPKAL